ncbi:iron complex transport system permease protein [Streptoalloteichus tenebrarius]|uniref:Iron complex transport system permease protein n=1 Tax=Streptoalloteichus tenebrarius (strain ATCC 17920 / DSM 40477 / JCM 4838 / CBS 697.72 / NBRC 16177 / NCIMB 11028 / NRRL B-12390 / A12253. 1 / ISP 5477) TaxID=1933 RepID=A0ABT1HNF3_STRSD|nr:iron ABC transporter permease [Streptoalloteichus tenebrarius]MCP2257037.1 iron complex transport system permease protein [Streptoalloteichus tenebrarius]BFF00053.1 iron ABC transporter permease [Streptoalloteichus tenebrarius]
MTTSTQTPAGPTGARPLPRATRLAARHVALTVLLLAAAVALSVLLGAIDLGWRRVLAEVVAQLTGGTSPLSEREAAILWQLRVPRVVLAALVGAALAGSGAAYQGVFRNPLADPYLLGAAAGAGLAATLVMVAAPGAGHGALGPVPLAAFVGAVGGVALSWALGRSAGNGTATLVLAGVAVSAFLTAVQTFVQQLRSETLREVYTWMLGGLGTTGWDEVLVVLPYLAVAAVVLCLSGRLLDLLGLGDEEAGALGVRPAVVRVVVLAAASLATAAAVAVSGLIGFVGIVVPHLVRLTTAASYRVVLPLSLLGGAGFLVLADTVARTVLAPAELPVGVVTAFAGAPFFALVLRRARGRAR